MPKKIRTTCVDPDPSVRGSTRLLGVVLGTRWSTRIMVGLIMGMFIFGVTLSSSQPANAQAPQSQTLSAAASVQSPSLQVLPTTDENNTDGSPKEYVDDVKGMDNLSDACHYLTFCRWKSANAMPLPDAGFTKMTQMPGAIAGGLAQFVLAIAALGMFVVGMALTFAMSIDLLSKAVYTADYLFSVTVPEILGMNNGGIGSRTLAVLALGLLLTVVAKLFVPWLGRFGPNLGVKSLAIGAIGIVGLGIMGAQSTKNHAGSGTTNPAPIASLASGTGASISDSPQGAVSVPSNWAVLSPGWFVAQGYVIANNFGGAVTTVTSGISDAISNGYNSQGSNSCDRYVAAMHGAFQNTRAAQSMGGKSSVLLSYDKLMKSIYFHNYQLAAFGSSHGASNSWCRMAENQASIPAGEQMMLARSAGLYREALGTGGLGLSGSPSNVVDPNNPNADNGIQIGISEGRFLTSNGAWVKDSTESLEAANNFIGPNFRNADAGTQAAMYFAACEWKTPGANATLNPEWQGVKRADSDDPLQVPADDHSDGGNNDCTSKVMSNDTEDGFGADGSHQHRWNYTEDDGWEVVGSLFGWGSSSSTDKFSKANTKAGNPALNYYLTMQGSNAAASLVLAVIAACLIWLIIRYFGPVLLGAVLSQALAVACMILASLMIVLLVIPFEKPRLIFVTVIKVLCASLIVASLLSILFGFTFALTTLFTALLSGTSSDAMIQALLSGFGAILGFWVVRTIVHSFTGLNLGTLSGGIQVGLAAGSPTLQSLGFDVVSPLSKDFWSWSRNGRTTPSDRLLTNDDNSPTARESVHNVDDAKNLLVDKKDTKGLRNKLDLLTEGPRRLSEKGVPYLGAAASLAEHAQNLRAKKDDPSTALGKAKAATDSGMLEVRRALSGQTGDREKGIYLKKKPTSDRAGDANSWALVEALAPLDPSRVDVSEKARMSAGIITPSLANLRRYGSEMPGMPSLSESKPMTPAEVRLLFRQQRDEIAATEMNGQRPVRSALERDAAVQWLMRSGDSEEVPCTHDGEQFPEVQLFDGRDNSPSLDAPLASLADPSRSYTPEDLVQWHTDLDGGADDPLPTDRLGDLSVHDDNVKPGSADIDRVLNKLDRHRDSILHTFSYSPEEQPSYVPVDLWARWAQVQTAIREESATHAETASERLIELRQHSDAIMTEIIDLFGGRGRISFPGQAAEIAGTDSDSLSAEERGNRVRGAFEQLMRDAEELRQRRADGSGPA